MRRWGWTVRTVIGCDHIGAGGGDEGVDAVRVRSGGFDGGRPLLEVDGSASNRRATGVEYAAADDGAGRLREDVEDKAVDGVEVADVWRHVPGVIVAAPSEIDVHVEVVSGIAIAVDNHGMAGK